MNGVDIAVVIIVILLVLAIIGLRFVLPRIMNHHLRKKGKDVQCGCSKCKHN